MADTNLRVMQFNLLTSTKKRRSHPWRLRKRNIAKIFENFQPDVVGTQEANYSQLLDLAELLPEYDFLGEGNLGNSMFGDEKNWYCATFYRRDRIRPLDNENSGESLWLSGTPEVPASQFHLGSRPRLVTWNNFELIGSGQKFVFGTTHLEAVNPLHRMRSALMLREHVSRRVEELGGDLPVFLTGDFNAVAGSPEIRAMEEARVGLEPLFDAWAEVRGNSDPEGATFRGLGFRDRMGQLLLGPRRIDYVFFRPRLTVRSIDRVDFTGMEHRPNALPSDHFPVLAEFSLAG
ncbi:MAG: endonuclease/exonuclease/phosphatase family protein [Gemmatimonadales bacterium]|nr:endonuclease/exonuclease/phosphatase family protein [Gemmatimonadales bacterium]